jgi:hypothetical protein
MDLLLCGLKTEEEKVLESGFCSVLRSTVPIYKEKVGPSDDAWILNCGPGLVLSASWIGLSKIK